MAQNIDYGNRNTFSALTGKLYSKVVRRSEIQTVALTGSYNDLTDKPAIPDGNLYVKKAGDTITGNIVSERDISVNLGSQDRSFANVFSGKFGVQRNNVSYGFLAANIGTVSVVGQTWVFLGNNIASGIAHNSTGRIRVFGEGSGYTDLIPGNNSANSITLTLPSTGGTLARTSDNVASATVAAKVNLIENNPASGTIFRIPFVADTGGSITSTVNENDGFKLWTARGTASTLGYVGIFVGNGTASGNVGNKFGRIRFYGTDSHWWQVTGEKVAGADYTLRLPKINGCLVAVPTDGAAVGNASTPVYVNANGRVVACTDVNAESATKAATVTVTLNNPTSEQQFAVPFHSEPTSGAKALQTNNGMRYYTSEGTTSATGYGMLVLGNGTQAGNNGNKYGCVTVFSRLSGCWYVSGDKPSGGRYTLKLPETHGCLVAVPTDGAAVGNSSTPVYVNANGQVVACTDISAGALDFAKDSNGNWGYVDPETKEVVPFTSQLSINSWQLISTGLLGNGCTELAPTQWEFDCSKLGGTIVQFAIHVDKESKMRYSFSRHGGDNSSAASGGAYLNGGTGSAQARSGSERSDIVTKTLLVGTNTFDIEVIPSKNGFMIATLDAIIG